MYVALSLQERMVSVFLFAFIYASTCIFTSRTEPIYTTDNRRLTYVNETDSLKRITKVTARDKSDKIRYVEEFADHGSKMRPIKRVCYIPDDPAQVIITSIFEYNSVGTRTKATIYSGILLDRKMSESILDAYERIASLILYKEDGKEISEIIEYKYVEDHSKSERFYLEIEKNPKNSISGLWRRIDSKTNMSMNQFVSYE